MESEMAPLKPLRRMAKTRRRVVPPFRISEVWREIALVAFSGAEYQGLVTRSKSGDSGRMMRR